MKPPPLGRAARTRTGVQPTLRDCSPAGGDLPVTRGEGAIRAPVAPRRCCGLDRRSAGDRRRCVREPASGPLAPMEDGHDKRPHETSDDGTLHDLPLSGWRASRSTSPRSVPVRELEYLAWYVRRSRYFVERSQAQLAEMSGVSQSMISRLELARAPAMRLDRFVKLTNALGRAFPLGQCPHDHGCPWQPIRPSPPRDEERQRRLDLLIESGLDFPFPWLGD